MITQLKQSLPNIYIILVAISISTWFEGVGILIRHFIPGRDLKTGLIMCALAISVFLMDDGNLSELYNYNPKKDSLSRHAPVAVAARRD
jgi:hypothetical protein|tara:strand:+ start:520 stop:786 length:267 start_codon:yes stop_codon:yes gene_type:complete